jgi:hypothetical protein
VRGSQEEKFRLVPVILIIQEGDMGKIIAGGQPRQKVHETPHLIQ